MKPKSTFALLFAATFFIGCSESTPAQEKEVVDSTSEVIEEEVIEEEPEVSTADFIKGTWEKIAQSCDADGNNCDETKGTDWIFDGEHVKLGRIEQPYTVSNDTIYIVDSPYRVAKEWGDTILLNGIAKDRYMKLVRKHE